MRRILILAANPKNTTRLHLGEEVRDISEGLKRASHGDAFEIVQRWAVRPRDLQRAMLEELPQIVHFSGHGAGDTGLYFQQDDGNAKLITGQALASLFRLISQESPINCVLLNSCYSRTQAEAIVEYVPYVVGMNASVGDRAAIEFSVGFYDALGNGKSMEFAFELGKVAMELNGTGDDSVPLLLKGKNQAKSSPASASKKQLTENNFLLIQVAQLLQAKSYQQAVILINKVLEHDSLNSKACYYLALAKLRGRRPKVLRRAEVEEIDRLLNTSLISATESSAIHFFRAVLRDDYYISNSLRCPSPSPKEIINSINEVDVNALRELITFLPRFKSNLYTSIFEKYS
ncbi:CHAT domain-containing protein [Leptolyngbya cf. ectocarpi LEGE 11479]|uniref:CHAT domain-containing protein n=1 Tax=Leptolyngbya cf. ectocarpi LEGE 11479 TaxID=1828722 RepID=A0A928X3M8_LEPEC|nr:CHAT domain-containing protein [Leptolyngbya ectocarpi]MBE9066468.1 CHAT domain-containing protein [Leptolyngbya cf. ectocarpi LEGE 11479]